MGYNWMKPKLRPSLVKPLMEARMRKKHQTEKATTPKKTNTSSNASNIELRNGCNGGSTITYTMMCMTHEIATAAKRMPPRSENQKLNT